MKLTIQRSIAAPPERVFELASDFAGAADVVGGISGVEMLTDGPVGVGTRFRETRVMYGREASEEMEVTEFDPPTGYALGCENHGTRYRSEFRFTPQGDGTDLEMVFEAVPVTFLAKVMSVVMRPAIKSVAKHIEQDLDDIKQAAEAG